MSDTAASVEDAFTSKLGPLPVYGWALIAVGVFLVIERYFSGTAVAPADTEDASDPSTTDSTALDDGSGDPDTDPYGNDYSGGGFETDGTVGGLTYGSSVGGTVTTYTTNQQWLIGAINNLRAQGFDAGGVTTALTLYLSGAQLSSNDAAIVSAAINAIGPPPDPLPIIGSGDPITPVSNPPVDDTPPPATPPTTPTDPGPAPFKPPTTTLPTTPTTPVASPPSGSGLQVIRSGQYKGVWYNGQYVGPLNKPVYTQSQYNALSAKEQAKLHDYTITGSNNAPIANGKSYS